MKSEEKANLKISVEKVPKLVPEDCGAGAPARESSPQKRFC